MQLLILSSLIASAPVLVDEAPAQAKAMIDRTLLVPLTQAEEKRSRFSRARIAPRLRSVRLTDGPAQKDQSGAEFFAFAIDERRGLGLERATGEISGCVYPMSGEVFIKRGPAHYPAAFLLGKTKEKAAEHVCVRHSY